MLKTLKKTLPSKLASDRRTGSNFLSFKNASAAEEIAIYYGFTPIDVPVVRKEDMFQAKEIHEGEMRPRSVPAENECYFDVCPEEKVAILRTYFEKNMHALPQPVCLFFEGHFDSNPSKKNGDLENRYELEILGTSKSIAEAILLQTSLEILKAEGFENLYIDINTIGDRESIIRFHKELTAYYRKNINLLQPHCRQALKRDPFEVLECQNEKCMNLKEEAPTSMAFLSELSRIHFREVLEYLETMNVPYKINPYIVGNRFFTTHTVFQIKNISEKDDEKAETLPLAVGIRYNSLAKKVGLKRDVPAIGVTIAFRRRKALEKRFTLRMERPKIFFIQLGFEAKLKSLRVIEMLRQAGIAIYQSLSRDKLLAQLSLAENMKIPYTIIMGQKEAVENSIIVRNMNTRSQETIKIEDLPAYSRKLK